MSTEELKEKEEKTEMTRRSIDDETKPLYEGGINES